MASCEHCYTVIGDVYTVNCNVVHVYVSAAVNSFLFGYVLHPARLIMIVLMRYTV